MARPPKTLKPEDVFHEAQATQLQSIPFPEPMPEAVEYDDVTALSNVLAELGADEAGGGFVTVFREITDSSGKKPDEYLERFPASDFSLDAVKERWGHGKYKINVYHDGGLLTRKVIIIAKSLNAPGPVIAQPAPTDLTPILQAMQDGFKQMFAAMQQNQPKQQTRGEMIQEMMLMREMFAPAQNSQPQQRDPIELMKLGMELAANAGNGGESNNAWVSKALDQLGPILMPALAKGLEQPAATPARASLPAPAPRPAPIDAIQLEDNPVNGLIYNYLNMLKRAAEQKASVEEYADSILNMVPASSVPELEAMLSPTDWREQMRKKTTVVDQYPEWFGGLRDALLQYIEEDKQTVATEVTTHLTPVAAPVSVPSHENATSTDGAIVARDPASPA